MPGCRGPHSFHSSPRLRNHPPVRPGQREVHAHAHLVDVDDRIAAGLRGNQPAQDVLRREPPRRADRGVGIVPEVGVDLGLRDLSADLLRAVGPEAQRLQAPVDRIDMRAVRSLLADMAPLRSSPISTMIFWFLILSRHGVASSDCTLAWRSAAAAFSACSAGSSWENLKPCACAASRPRATPA